MSQLNKGKAKYILELALVLLLFTITMYCSANGFSNKDFHSYLTTDTIPVKAGKDLNADSVKKQNQKTTAGEIAGNKISDTNIVVKTDTFAFNLQKNH